MPEPELQTSSSEKSCGVGGCGLSFKPKRFVIGAVVGAGLGFAYWYFVGCQSGHCPITSSPIASSLYGAGMLAVLLGL